MALLRTRKWQYYIFHTFIMVILLIMLNVQTCHALNTFTDQANSSSMTDRTSSLAWNKRYVFVATGYVNDEDLSVDPIGRAIRRYRLSRFDLQTRKMIIACENYPQPGVFLLMNGENLYMIDHVVDRVHQASYGEDPGNTIHVNCFSGDGSWLWEKSYAFDKQQDIYDIVLGSDVLYVLTKRQVIQIDMTTDVMDVIYSSDNILDILITSNHYFAKAILEDDYLYFEEWGRIVRLNVKSGEVTELISFDMHGDTILPISSIRQTFSFVVVDSILYTWDPGQKKMLAIDCDTLTNEVISNDYWAFIQGFPDGIQVQRGHLANLWVPFMIKDGKRWFLPEQSENMCLDSDRILMLDRNTFLDLDEVAPDYKYTKEQLSSMF